MVEPGWMADRSQESYCSLVKVTVRGDEEPLLYRGGLTLQGLISLQLCHIALLSPWLLITRLARSEGDIGFRICIHFASNGTFQDDIIRGMH